MTTFAQQLDSVLGDLAGGWSSAEFHLSVEPYPHASYGDVDEHVLEKASGVLTRRAEHEFAFTIAGSGPIPVVVAMQCLDRATIPINGAVRLVGASAGAHAPLAQFLARYQGRADFDIDGVPGAYRLVPAGHVMAA